MRPRRMVDALCASLASLFMLWTPSYCVDPLRLPDHFLREWALGQLREWDAAGDPFEHRGSTQPGAAAREQPGGPLTSVREYSSYGGTHHIRVSYDPTVSIEAARLEWRGSDESALHSCSVLPYTEFEVADDGATFVGHGGLLPELLTDGVHGTALTFYHADGSAIATYSGPGYSVRHYVAFMSDGTFVLSSAGVITGFNARTGKIAWTRAQESADHVPFLIRSPDGGKVLVASSPLGEPTELTLLSVAGMILGSYRLQERIIHPRAVIFGPDGAILVRAPGTAGDVLEVLDDTALNLHIRVALR